MFLGGSPSSSRPSVRHVRMAQLWCQPKRYAHGSADIATVGPLGVLCEPSVSNLWCPAHPLWVLFSTPLNLLMALEWSCRGLFLARVCSRSLKIYRLTKSAATATFLAIKVQGCAAACASFMPSHRSYALLDSGLWERCASCRLDQSVRLERS